MDYTVINGGTKIASIVISTVSNSSLFMLGDITKIQMINAFETPAEKVIVGVTIPIIE